MNFLFGKHAEIIFELDGEKDLPKIEFADFKQQPIQSIYQGKQKISGKIHIKLLKQKKLEFTEIKLELVGQIEQSSSVNQFTQLVNQLSGAGELNEDKTYDFEFANVDKQFETYMGESVRLRYFLRCVIVRNYGKISQNYNFAVQNIHNDYKNKGKKNLESNDDGNENDDTNDKDTTGDKDGDKDEKEAKFQTEVGIKNGLNLEFEYDKTHFHLHDVIIGKVYFLLVKIKIKKMKIVLQRKEILEYATDEDPLETQILGEYHLMDGTPVRGTKVPIRLYLNKFSDLTPTYQKVHRRFSVKYYLNIVLTDTENRRYYKKKEIMLKRQALSTTADEKKRIDFS